MSGIYSNLKEGRFRSIDLCWDRSLCPSKVRGFYACRTATIPSDSRMAPNVQEKVSQFVTIHLPLTHINKKRPRVKQPYSHSCTSVHNIRSPGVPFIHSNVYTLTVQHKKG